LRLDKYLFEKKLANSRNKASEMIKNREVMVDGKVVTKTSFDITEKMDVKVEENRHYVSRAGYKLKGFLQELNSLHVEDLECLDIGSSTGGFVEVLLEFGAKSVTCVDVGKDQLHKSLRDNEKIKLFENTDIRQFKSDDKFDLVTCDVSFIGVEQILEDIDRLAKDRIIILFKPQFEVGVGVKRNKKGVVKDNLAIKRVKEIFEANCFKRGWKLLEKKDSILKGKEGNEETFYYFSKR
jgi:23S rRNA (cytidine1920-2'-O)/16S rRNA (cytidine1409-2'-O)-methyltransferase